MDLNPNTFCAAPWFQIRNEQFGEYKVCAIIDSQKSNFSNKTQYRWPEHSPEEFLQSEYNQYLREQLTQGNALPECHRCWNQECAGSKSLRQKINDTLSNNKLEQSWIVPYIRKKNNYQHDLVVSADVKLTNTCNFSCAMCYPGDSSQIYSAWSRDRDHPVIQDLLKNQPTLLQLVRENYKDRNNHQLLELLLSKRPQRIKLLGGEPLLDQAALRILQNVSDEDKKCITLSFVTNGSVDLVNADRMLAGYRDINYVISVDGIGSVQDYIRKGSNWKSIEENIDRWIDSNPGKKLDLHTTVQALNVSHLNDLYSWASTRPISIGLGLLHSPNYMSLSVIPDDIKIQLIENARPDVANLLADATFDPSLLSQLTNFLNWYDPDQTWRCIFPEWVNVL